MVESSPIYELVSHPSDPNLEFTLHASLNPHSTGIKLFFELNGPVDLLELPETKFVRMDQLWKTTCCEAFVGTPDGGYLEFNFAPYSGWNIYKFASYRQGMSPLQNFSSPTFNTTQTESSLKLEGNIPIQLPKIEYFNLCGILSTKEQEKAHFAIKHPNQTKADFHDPKGWAAS